jgi:hypothetical protein
LLEGHGVFKKRPHIFSTSCLKSRELFWAIGSDRHDDMIMWSVSELLVDVVFACRGDRKINSVDEIGIV